MTRSLKDLTPQQRERLRLKLYASRECGTCRACCTLLYIEELDKPAGKACAHLSADLETKNACTIYERRPDPCRAFACVWRTGSDVMSPAERPDRVGIMVDTMREIPGKPWTDALLVYSTREAGLLDASFILDRLATKRAVLIVRDGGKEYELFGGPEDKIEELHRVLAEDAAALQAQGSKP